MKKFLALLLAMIMVLSVCVAASAEAKEYDITIWAPEEVVELTRSQVEAFNANNEYGIKFNVTIEPVSPPA